MESKNTQIDPAKVKALNLSQETLLDIEKRCKEKLIKRMQDAGVFDPDPDATHVPDVQYYKDFIGELSDKFNHFVLEAERWKEKAIKLQSGKK